MADQAMCILVSNHDTEIATFRRALGDATMNFQIVENNLSALSVISGHVFEIGSLVITEHQDQAINVDTGVFVQNLLSRAPGLWTTVVVGLQSPDLLSLPVDIVDTIEEAADIVRRRRQPAFVGADVVGASSNGHSSNGNGNGHGHHFEDTEVLVSFAEPETTTFEQEAPIVEDEAADQQFHARIYENVAPVTEEPEAVVANPWLTDEDVDAASDKVDAQREATITTSEPWITEPSQAVVEEPPTASVTTPVESAVAPITTPVVAQLDIAPEPSVVQPQPVQPAAIVAQPPVAAPTSTTTTPSGIDDLPELTHSLADDIRDWTKRNEQQRGQQRSTPQTSTLMQGLVELLPSQRRAHAQEEALDAAIREPRLSTCHSVAVISPKGGVGKSFLTYLIGNFLADVRGDKIVAIDTNPDFGTLADQVRGREEQTVSTLLEQLDDISHYSDLRRFTSKVETRLEVLAAPADPDVMATITANDYDRVNTQLRHYYDTVLFDCGTGFRDDITRYALEQADQVVLVSAPLFITTGIVIRALGYLDGIGVPLDRVTLAINQVRRGQPLDLGYMHERFGSRLNAIVEIPFDMQLYHDMDQGEFSVKNTQIATRIKVKQLLAELVKRYA